jgi:phospholipid/cholesterol/gamma-HCH transport system ATP-binding protein
MADAKSTRAQTTEYVEANRVRFLHRLSVFGAFAAPQLATTVESLSMASATPTNDGLPIVRFEKVGVRFGLHEVLRGIDLGVERGRTLVVIGESGCGKTVLLKLIVALIAPSGGDVQFEGKSLEAMRERELTALRRRIGFLFQGAALFDSLNVLDNVAFGLRALGGLKEEDVRERVRQRLLEVGLPANAETKMPAELSGGMKKRVGLARALALDPEVMLYDEPTTGLDPIMSDVINELILQTRKRRPVTSIVVTHDMKTARKVADRIVMLHPLAHLDPEEQQIVFDGSPDEIMQSADRRVRQFIEGEAGSRDQ